MPVTLDTHTIGKRIRQLRLQKLIYSPRWGVKAPMTQAQLARTMGITGSTSEISLYETGERKVSTTTLRRIARALGVKYDQLMG